MGSANIKRRKPRHPLAKVPKYEEPNTVPLLGLSGDPGLGKRKGRFGYGSDGRERHRPSLPGRLVLRLLGMRRNDPEEVDPDCREHGTPASSEEGTLPPL